MQFEKRYLDFMMPLIVVVFSIITAFVSLPYNLDSIYDEGYHCLVMRDAIEGNVFGSSIYSNIMLAVLGPSVCASVLSLRIAGTVLSIVTALLFWMITENCVAKSKMSKIAYLITIMFVLQPIGGIVLCYNEISRLLLIFACAAIFRLVMDDNKWGIVWAVPIGFAVMLSFFSILPSSVLIGGGLLVVLVVRYWKQWRKLLVLLAMMIIGAVIALGAVHFFVVDLRQVAASMRETAQTITGVNRGYDPLSFIIKTIWFFRDMVLYLLTALGVMVTARFFKKNGYSWLGMVFYIAAFMVYWRYQKKPMVTVSMMMAAIWFQPMVNKCLDSEMPKLKQLVSFDFLFNLFLCFFPVLATIGTNLPIGIKLGWFILPWALLLWRLGFDDDNWDFRFEVLLVFSIITIIGCINQVKTVDSTQTIVKQGPLKGMRLDSYQEKHFEEVGKLLDDYQYKKNETVIYASQASMMALCYFEAKPVGLFFQPSDFVAQASDSLPVPDFVFMDEGDDYIASETMKKLSWGWPEEFDKYFVGTPEHINPGWSTDRWLYCRKSLRK